MKHILILFLSVVSLVAQTRYTNPNFDTNSRVLFPTNLVIYTAATGASNSLTLNEHFSLLPHSRHYGTDPTGVADSTVALQNAINANYGKALRISGDLRVTNTITITNTIMLIGDGNNINGSNKGTRILGNMTNAILYATNVDRLVIQDITFGKSAASTNLWTNGVAMLLEDCTDGYIERVGFYHTKYGLLLRRSYGMIGSIEGYKAYIGLSFGDLDVTNQANGNYFTLGTLTGEDTATGNITWSVGVDSTYGRNNTVVGGEISGYYRAYYDTSYGNIYSGTWLERNISGGHIEYDAEGLGRLYGTDNRTFTFGANCVMPNRKVNRWQTDPIRQYSWHAGLISLVNFTEGTNTTILDSIGYADMSIAGAESNVTWSPFGISGGSLRVTYPSNYVQPSNLFRMHPFTNDFTISIAYKQPTNFPSGANGYLFWVQETSTNYMALHDPGAPNAYYSIITPQGTYNFGSTPHRTNEWQFVTFGYSKASNMLTLYDIAFGATNLSHTSLITNITGGLMPVRGSGLYTIEYGLVAMWNRILGEQEVREFVSEIPDQYLEPISDTLAGRNKIRYKFRGDEAVTLQPVYDRSHQIWATPLTTQRIVTLATNGAFVGQTFNISRAPTATGSSALRVSNNTNDIAVGGSAEYVYTGTNWVMYGGSGDISSKVSTNFNITANLSVKANPTNFAGSAVELYLENDQASPGANKAYSTDGTGTKGWFAISSGSSFTLTNGIGVNVSSNSAVYTIAHNVEAGANVTLSTNGAALVITAATSGGSGDDVYVNGANVTHPDFDDATYIKFVVNNTNVTAYATNLVNANIASGAGIDTSKLDLSSAISESTTNLSIFGGLTAHSGVFTNSLTVNGTNITGAIASKEANTASNLGTGYGVWYDKSGVDLRFNSISNGIGVTVASNANLLTIRHNIEAGANITLSTNGSALVITGAAAGGSGDDVYVNGSNVTNPDFDDSSTAIWSVNNTNVTVYPTNIANAQISASAAIAATKIADGSVDNTEFQYLNNVTSAIQTQLNGKQASFTTGVGVTNESNVVRANLAAGSNITFTTNSNGQISIASSAGGSGIAVQEQDGSPTNTFTLIKVTNGTLTDNGDGSASIITGAGSAGGTGFIRLPVQSAKLPSSNPARIDAGENNYRLLFDASTDQSASWQFEMPTDMNASVGIEVAVNYSHASATANGSIFTVEIMAVTAADTADVNTDSYDTATSTTFDTYGTAGYMGRDVFSIAVADQDDAQPGDYIRLRLTRDADNASDTAVGDAEVLSVTVYYTKQ